MSDSRVREAVRFRGVLEHTAVSVLLAVSALVAASDATAQTSARAAAPAPPGRLIDIGGYRLHLYCVGQGSPTVVLLHGFGDYSFDWSLVQPAVARTTERARHGATRVPHRAGCSVSPTSSTPCWRAPARRGPLFS